MTEEIADQAREAVLSESLDREPLELGDVEVRIREMTVGEFEEFAEIDEHPDKGMRDTMKLILKAVETPDGQQVFDPRQDLDAILSAPAQNSHAQKLRDAFLKVNSLSSAPEQGDEGNSTS